MLWHSRDTLWTVGREGVFQQNDVHHAPKVVDRRTLQAIAVSPSGEIGGVAQKRPRRRRSTGLTYPEDTYAVDPRDKRNSPEKSSLRSSTDNSFDETFLSSRRHHGRTASNRSAKSFGSTPPSDAAPKVMFLTDSMTVQHEHQKPNQLAFRGTLPGTMNVHVFAYLAQKYKAIPLPDPPTLQSFEDLHHVFEQNAEYAQRAAFYRLATTWKFVGMSIANATQRRAHAHRNQRRGQTKPSALASSDIQPNHTTEQSQAHDYAARQADATTANLPVDVVQTSSIVSHGTGHHIAIAESTSNLATPLARPLTGIPSAFDDHRKSRLPDLDRDEKIELPPAVTGPYSDRDHLAPDSASPYQSVGGPTFKGPQWYHSSNDLDERRAMVGSWRAPPRVPLSYEHSESSRRLDIQVPPRLDRHDSDESFAMFSASSDSQRGNSMPSSLSSSRSHPQDVNVVSQKRQDQPDESSFGNSALPKSDAANQPGQISPTTVPVGESGNDEMASHNGDKLNSITNGVGHSTEIDSQEQAVQEIENLRRNNQLLRHDSSESEAFTCSDSGLSVSSLVEPSHDMEASGTIVPEGYDGAWSPQGPKPHATLEHAIERALPGLDPAAEDPILLEDYQAMHMDADEGSPFAMIGLLEKLLSFYTDSQADAQTSSLLLLLLAPLLPQTRLGEAGIDLGATLAAYTETFSLLGLSTAQSENILSTGLTHIIAAGINPFQAEAILEAYHSQLHSLMLYNAAATVRRLTYPTYPAVYEQALKSTQIGLLCLSCKSPINNPKDKMRCETCKRAQAPCSICWGRYPAFDALNAKKKAKSTSRIGSKDHKRKRSSLVSNLAITVNGADSEPSPSIPNGHATPNAFLWSWCPVCGHGGHTNCLSTWFSDGMSDGACATEGCLCDCVQGKRREERIQHILQLKAEKERSKVVRKGDDWKVNESRAVSAVRGAFDEKTPNVAPNVRDVAQNNGSNTTAQGLRTKEDGRRVRVVEPHADPH